MPRRVLGLERVKSFLVFSAIVIAVVSLLVSHFLTRDLYDEERAKMAIWAEAMRTLNVADENTDLNLVLRVINDNRTIPVIVMDAHGDVQIFRNVKLYGISYTDSLARAGEMAINWKQKGQYIRIHLSQTNSLDYIDVCYDDSSTLKRISIYPYIQLGVVLLFVIVAIFALLTSNRAEQNKVWVGLSKETAHQLGTPISSIMAWIEVLKETYPNDELLPEMEKDVQRLELIADRFSKIGSVPEFKKTSINKLLQGVAEYIDKRSPHKVKIVQELGENEVFLPLIPSLFEWVVENLCKNAIDAIGEEGGRITVRLIDEKYHMVIEVEDTGKGIKKSDIKRIFRPGFTTKSRGWGLGLSLARRIIEVYHKGEIFVKHSERGVGTTFRIVLDADLVS